MSHRPVSRNQYRYTVLLSRTGPSIGLVMSLSVLIGAILPASAARAVVVGSRSAGVTMPTGVVPGDDGPPVLGPYQPPVVAPIIDPFRAPANPYGPGNRGIDYATEPDTPVGAVGDGFVTFAGVVAGTRHVTVLHPDGIRTSYSFLAVILVSAGDHVRRGDPVGLAGPVLHVGARTGPRRYIDPAGLWADRRHVWLVPMDGAGTERSPSSSGGWVSSGEPPDPRDLAATADALAESMGQRITLAAAALPG